jgi:hypothetical protein
MSRVTAGKVLRRTDALRDKTAVREKTRKAARKRGESVQAGVLI